MDERQTAIDSASRIVAALVQSGDYSNLTDEEILAVTVAMADKILVPYITNGIVIEPPKQEVEEGAPF